MGTVVFRNTLVVDVVTGRPEHVQFPEPAQQFARYADRKGRYAQLPDDLRQMHRAMQVAIPPEEFVVASAGQTGLKAQIQTLFGSGQRSPTDNEWHPTDLVVEGARAWVRRQRWKEGGGDGWFGSPIYHDWAVAGAFIRDAELRQWADELFEHPLGRLIEADTNYGHVYTPAGTDPRSWFGVEVESESFSLHDSRNHDVVDGKVQPGIHRTFQVKWGLWSGRVSVYLPEYWQIETEADREYPVSYPFLVARNGREERRFAPPYASLEADREFIASGNTDGQKTVEYTTELPDLPEFIQPIEATGNFAAFFRNMASLQNFARQHNIRAKKPFLGLHAPHDDEPGAALLPLTREFAELAWKEGATKTPQVVGELPPLQEWKKEPDGRIYFRIGERRGHRGTTDEVAWFSDGWGNCEERHRGWVCVPTERRVGMPFGLTVRDSADPIRGYHETVVYNDGRVQLAER